MRESVTLYRPQRRRLERQVQTSSDVLHTRRILAVLYLADRHSVSAVARRLAAARSSVGRWRALLGRTDDWHSVSGPKGESQDGRHD